MHFNKRVLAKPVIKSLRNLNYSNSNKFYQPDYYLEIPENIEVALIDRGVEGYYSDSGNLIEFIDQLMSQGTAVMVANHGLYKYALVLQFLIPAFKLEQDFMQCGIF